jgi:hypothetical protein
MLLTTVILMSACGPFKSPVNGGIAPPCPCSGGDCEMWTLASCSYQLPQLNLIVAALPLPLLNLYGPRATWRGCDKSVSLGFRDRCE